MLLKNLPDSQLLFNDFIRDPHKYLLSNIYHLIFVHFFILGIILVVLVLSILFLSWFYLRVLLVTIVRFWGNFLSGRLVEVRLLICLYNRTVIISWIFLDLRITAVIIFFFLLLSRWKSVLVILFYFLRIATFWSHLCGLSAFLFWCFVQHGNQHFVFHFFDVFASRVYVVKHPV